MVENKEVTIEIYEAIGGNAAVSSDDGDMIFKRIDKAFQQNLEVIVDFKNVDLIVSTFLNASIGQLYGSYTSDFIKEHLKVENMVNDDLNILKKVIERAKEYFANKNDSDATIAKNLDE